MRGGREKKKGWRKEMRAGKEKWQREVYLYNRGAFAYQGKKVRPVKLNRERV